MACRILDLTVDKATNLKAVTHINKMKVYVVVSLDESPHCTQVSKSPVDVDGGIDPTWSFSVKLYVDEPSAQENRLNIHFKLLCDNHFGDSDVGEVVVPVKKLLDSAAAHGEASTVTYSVCRPFGRLEGKLHFSYKFSDKLTAEVGSPGRSAAPKADGAPPVVDAPPADRVDGQPTPPGNGDYPNQQAQQVPKKNRMGLGLEAGVALGRLVIECALEAADAADAI